MFTITVEKECGCFQKSDFSNYQKVASKDDALIEAQEMVGHMNENFCQKHAFTLLEEGENFMIRVDERAKAQTGCCGGGHCS